MGNIRLPQCSTFGNHSREVKMYICIFHCEYFSWYPPLICTLPAKQRFLLERFVVLMFRSFPCVQSNRRRGATVHFSCDEGYELQGSKSISCLRVTDSYVGWSDDRPICRGKDWRVGCPSMHMCNGGRLSVTSIYISIPRTLTEMCLLVRLLLLCVSAQSIFIFSILWIQCSPFHCDWSDFDLWPASFCFLLFSHAGIVLPISHVFLTSDCVVTGRKSGQAPCTVLLMLILSSVPVFSLSGLN